MREVHELLRQTALATEQHVRTAARTLGVPVTDVHAIGVLRHQAEGVSASELGRSLGLSAPATTALVDRLVASGHAERAASSSDRRQVLIRPTDSAVQHSRDCFERLNAVVDAVLASHHEDGEVFTRVLRDVHAAMTASQQP